VALAAQVPYSVILLGSFEVFDSIFTDYELFNRYDDYSFWYKFLSRFGASTLSVVIAQALCYPFDTVKRRLQINGAKGYKNIYKNEYHCVQKILAEESYRGFYRGFSINLCRTIPLAFLQFACF